MAIRKECQKRTDVKKKNNLSENETGNWKIRKFSTDSFHVNECTSIITYNDIFNIISIGNVFLLQQVFAFARTLFI